MEHVRKSIRVALEARGWNKLKLATETGLSHRLIYQFLDDDNPGDVKGASLLAILSGLGFQLVAPGGMPVSLGPTPASERAAKPGKRKAGAR